MTSPALDTVAATRAARSRPPQSRPVALGQPVPVCVAYGDGIGPEIMEATLAVLQAAGARLALEPVELGAKVYERGVSAGIDARSLGVAAANPGVAEGADHHAAGRRLQEPQRHAAQDARAVRQRAALASYHPFVSTRHPGMNLVIVRENEEDLYAGIEHRQTRDVVQCLKLISVPGTERIVRYAFEYARALRPAQGHLHDQGQHHEDDRRAVRSTFRRDRRRVPGHRAGAPDHRHRHGDAGRRAGALRRRSSRPNLYGDILSDVAAQIAGSVGMAGSANIGARRGDVRGDPRLGARHRAAQTSPTPRASSRPR